ncbi:hypothetical protein TorRG33x02_148630 [Trema orientale]|uniref:Uncharacterized protein n=1 Tax=Trema orientale TaxID=63057 RepID=A0A2P5EUU6_TREOI|nr:hypothetical protein TorRG33x02_148630 [Trema orientale]
MLLRIERQQIIHFHSSKAAFNTKAPRIQTRLTRKTPPKPEIPAVEPLRQWNSAKSAQQLRQPKEVRAEGGQQQRPSSH